MGNPAIDGEVEGPKAGKAVATKRKTDVAQPVGSTVSAESAAIFQMIERVARDKDVDIGRMERLVQMQQDAETRSARKEFLAALSEMQAELPAVERKGTG